MSILIKNFFTSFITRGLVSFGLIVFNFIISKILGYESLGLIIAGFSIITGLSVFCRFGLNQSLLKYVSIYFEKKNIDSLKNHLKISSIYIITLSIITSLILIFFGNKLSIYIYNSDKYSNIFFFLGLILPFLTFVHIQRAILKSFKLPATSNFSTFNAILLFSSIIILVTNFFGYEFNINRVYFVILVLTITVFGINNLIIIFVITGIINKQNVSYENVRLNITSSLGDFYIMDILNYFLLWGSLSIISYFVESEILGYFNSIFWIIFAILLIPVTIDTIVSPYFAVYANQNKMNHLKKIFKNSRLFTILFSFPFLIILFIFTEYFLTFFPAEIPDEFTFITRILVFTVSLEIIFSHINSLLLMSGYHNSVKKVFIYNTILAIFFMIFLTSNFGIMGSAIAFFINFLIKNISLFYIYKKNII